MPIALNEANFETTVTTNPIVFVDCWAGWCMPCQRFAPVYDQAAKANPDIVFGKVDTEGEQSLAMALQIQTIPTIMAFRDGIMVFRESGALSLAQLNEVIKKVREVDMDDVRAQLSQPKPSA